MASPFETIDTLLKADVGPVVMAGTIKSKSIGFDTQRYLTFGEKSVQSDARGRAASF